MGTKNHPGAFDCYANAEPDEPMFVLLARDPDAPLLVMAWAQMREDSGENPAKVAEARSCAAQMESWRAGRKGAPEPKRCPTCGSAAPTYCTLGYTHIWRDDMCCSDPFHGAVPEGEQ